MDIKKIFIVIAMLISGCTPPVFDLDDPHPLEDYSEHSVIELTKFQYENGHIRFEWKEHWNLWLGSSPVSIGFFKDGNVFRTVPVGQEWFNDYLTPSGRTLEYQFSFYTPEYGLTVFPVLSITVP